MENTESVMIRFAILSFLLLLPACFLSGQTSLKEIDLKQGKYKVVFLHYTIADSTRTYSRIYDYTNEKIARPIPISIWHPAEEVGSNSKPLEVLDYLEILKEEEEWEHLPNEQILNWFYYANSPANQKHLAEETAAYSKANFAKGTFPVIVYAPSFQASSIENFALCEYLASHGFVVISSPSRGTDTRWFGNNNAKEMETQARDVEFLILEAAGIPLADIDKIALMGFSFGGLSNMIVQSRNDNIKAVVSLDGTERYQYEQLNQSPFFNVKNVNVPYLHMAQKDIPDLVLKEDNIDASLNNKFELYDSLSRSMAYRLKFHDLTHTYFSTLGVLFANRDVRQDKSDSEIMESYRLMALYSLQFLKSALEKDEGSTTFVNNTTAENSIPDGLIGYRRKLPEETPFTFQDFNDLALSQNYEHLSDLYDSIRSSYPDFELPEGNLNTLGLQLVFNPATSSQGIDVFLLATSIYPESANLYDSLAEGYLFTGDTEKAIESFERSLELNSRNQNAIGRLKELKE